MAELFYTKRDSRAYPGGTYTLHVEGCGLLERARRGAWFLEPVAVDQAGWEAIEDEVAKFTTSQTVECRCTKAAR